MFSPAWTLAFRWHWRKAAQKVSIRHGQTVYVYCFSSPVCRKSIYRNSTANILSLDTLRISVVIFTYVSVRFLASLESLQWQSYSFEQVTNHPEKPCPRAREGRALFFFPFYAEQEATGQLLSPALTPTSSLSSRRRALPHSLPERSCFPGADGLGSTVSPCPEGAEGTRRSLCHHSGAERCVQAAASVSQIHLHRFQISYLMWFLSNGMNLGWKCVLWGLHWG